MKVSQIDEYARRRLVLYGQFVKRDDLVINVGANIGTRTEVFAELGARVIALEPQPELVKRLRNRFRDRDKVIIIEAAAGPTVGTLDLMVFPDKEIPLATASAAWIRSIEDGYCMNWPMDKWTEKIIARQVTLDSVIGFWGLPQFIKIDVDGYEGSVLAGLSQKVPTLCFEVTIPYGDPAIDCIADVAERLGYAEFNYVVQEEALLVLDNWVPAGTMMNVLRSLPVSTFFVDVFAR